MVKPTMHKLNTAEIKMNEIIMVKMEKAKIFMAKLTMSK